MRAIDRGSVDGGRGDDPGYTSGSRNPPFPRPKESFGMSPRCGGHSAFFACMEWQWLVASVCLRQGRPPATDGKGGSFRRPDVDEWSPLLEGPFPLYP